MVTSWSQRAGHLLVGGDSKIIRLWDARVESLICEFPTQAGSNVTSISTSEDGDVFVSGFGDGVVRVFDKRLGLTTGSGEKGLVKVMRQHQTWVQSVWMRRDGELITGRSVISLNDLWRSRVLKFNFPQHERRGQDI